MTQSIDYSLTALALHSTTTTSTKRLYPGSHFQEPHRGTHVHATSHTEGRQTRSIYSATRTSLQAPQRSIPISMQRVLSSPSKRRTTAKSSAESRKRGCCPTPTMLAFELYKTLSVYASKRLSNADIVSKKDSPVVSQDGRREGKVPIYSLYAQQKKKIPRGNAGASPPIPKPRCTSRKQITVTLTP